MGEGKLCGGFHMQYANGWFNGHRNTVWQPTKQKKKEQKRNSTKFTPILGQAMFVYFSSLIESVRNNDSWQQ